MRKSNKNIIDKIEIKSIEIENQYNKIFDSFLNLNINNKTLASYFKKNKLISYYKQIYVKKIYINKIMKQSSF